MNRKMGSLFFATIILSMLITAPARAGKQEDTLNVAFEEELQTLDRYFNTAREGIVVARMVYDNLFYRDPVTYNYKPLLAKSYRWIDPTTLELELRRGITFHNGADFSAADVVYTLNWASDPSNKVKVQRYVNWIDRVEKLDDYRVRILLKHPFPATLEFLAMANPIYPKDYYAEAGPEGFGIRPIGTGPYRVVDMEIGKRVVFEKNESYFKESPKGQPSIGRIVWRTVPEVNTKVAELLTGGLDWIWRVPADQARELAKKPDIQVVSTETMRIGFLMMDAADRSGKEHGMDNPFKHLEVRRAISHAIDREAISRNLVGGSSRVVHSACYPSQFGCTQDVMKYAYDPAKARRLLAEAGYPDGFDCKINGYRDRPYAEAMIGYLQKVGIRAKLVMLKGIAVREKYRAGKLQFVFHTWGSYSINDVSAITSNFFEFGADDLARDPQVRDWLIQGDTSIDPDVRKEAYKKALQRIAEQAYWLPLFTFVANNCFTKDLEFTPYPDAVPRFFQARWK